LTVAIAWVRTIRDCEELLFVTDSRLSGDGRNFDGCPKILTLPRSDCVIAFAGYTGHAYPMMHQLALAIDAHAPLRRGSLDLSALKSHALKIFDLLSAQINISKFLSAEASTAPEAEFIFGGYSWIKKRFELWSIKYRSSEQRFVAYPAQWFSYSEYTGSCVFRSRTNLARTHPIGRIAFAGDQATSAKERLSELLSKDPNHVPTKFDMEPFQVVRDMLCDSARSETIGGAPQLTKVYQYMKSAPLGVYWPSKAGGVAHLQGRPLLGYERSERWVLDPDTLVSERPQYSRNDADDASPEIADDDPT
jgi:hypothetical protein